MKTLILLLGLCFNLAAATKYVDSIAVGANNGTSWADAWVNINSITASAGDTVYISGGPSGGNQTYYPDSLGGFPVWIPKSGTPGNRITYQIGQDSLHNGTAWFKGSNSFYWIGYQSPKPHDINIIGDAGDGAMHFRLTNYPTAGTVDGVTNLRLAYLNIGLGMGLNGSPIDGIEIDHCYNYTTNGLAGADTVWNFNSPDSIGVTANRFHDNISWSPQQGNSLGYDIVTVAGKGWTISNNFFGVFIDPTIPTGQHQDGVVSGGCSDLLLINNTFFGVGDYAFYIAINSGVPTMCSNIVAANNLFINCGGSIIMGTDFGVWPSLFARMILANNVIDNGSNAMGQSVALGGGLGVTNTDFVNCILANNIIVGGQNFSRTSYGTNIAYMTNVYLTTSQASNTFQSYSGSGSATTNSDLRPLPSASVIVNAGTNLYSYFATDYGGNQRSASGPWTIGAFEPSRVSVQFSGAMSMSGKITR